MTRLIAFTELVQPGLHVWREGTHLDIYLHVSEVQNLPAGAVAFDCELGTSPAENIYCQLFRWTGPDNGKTDWEQDSHVHLLPRLAGNVLPPAVYLFHGSSRAVSENPLTKSEDRVRIHLITASKYMQGRLILWNAPGMSTEPLSPTNHELSGPYWDVPLSGRGRSFFQFKFDRSVDGQWITEPDYANRVWVAADGAEIWTHSEARDVLSVMPVKRQLSVHFRQEIDPAFPPRMHVWQEGSDWADNTIPEAGQTGWTTHRIALYTGISYRLQFWNPTLQPMSWEDPEARRDIQIQGDEEWWTLEGDRHLFPALPQQNCLVALTLGPEPPGFVLGSPYGVRIWMNRARASLAEVTNLHFSTYSDVVTSFVILGAGGVERIDRHYLTGTPGQTTRGIIVLGRPPVLRIDPPADLFQNPPFLIRRPGAYEEGGEIRFVLHASWCAQVELEGDWMPVASRLPMHSTEDGTYWWAAVPVATIAAAHAGDYHGAEYCYILNGDADQHVQDPAASWAENSAPKTRSRLVQRSHHQWRSTAWQTPAWDYLRLYQLHPARFSNRAGAGVSPLDQITWEVENANGYFQSLSITALQLMPVNEIGTVGWGYDPALFYAIENDYGGPDALKRLVDACHQRGIAVLLDVVFNHAGTTDNILWITAQGTFFDGDTDWGAMINYDHPQVIHFFEQNLVYLLEEYRVDGFRFDFTRVIVHGHEAGEAHVKKPGSGGGWEFLHRLRRAALATNPRCLFIAEHLPNEWGVTNYGGPMDSQWCDNFHDRLKDAASGNPSVLSALAEALQLSRTRCDEWYKVTNYAESHDEVGNENGRMANVAGFGRGLRMAKVAATVVWLGRSLPLMLMGAEAGESRQFQQGRTDVLDLGAYLSDASKSHVRDWVNVLLSLHGNDTIHGPSPLTVVYAQDQQLAWVRGQGSEYFVLVNFSNWSGWKSLMELNLPDYTYRELWNSSSLEFQVESEQEHTNGGRQVRIGRENWLNVPAIGAVILERVG